MILPEAALWGLSGGAAAVGFAEPAKMLATGSYPWDRRAKRKPVGVGVWILATILQLTAGALTAMAATSAGIVPNGLVAFGIGFAGPSGLQMLVSGIPGLQKGVSILEPEFVSPAAEEERPLRPARPTRKRPPQASLVPPSQPLREELLDEA